MTTRRTHAVSAVSTASAVLTAAILALTSTTSVALGAGKMNYMQKMKLAESMYFNGNIEGAIRAFQGACELNPKAFEPHLGLVNLHVSNTDLPAAIEECHVCLKMKPDHRDAHLILGNLLRAQASNEEDSEKQNAMFKEAKETISKALELGANKAMCENTLGLICLQLKEHDKALEHIDNAIKASPNMADAHLVRGVLLFRKLTAPALASGTKIDLQSGQYKAQIDDILDELNLAIKQKTKNADAKNTKADIMMGLGKADEAVELYEDALEDDPHYFQACIALGNYYASKNDFKKGLDFFQRAHDITPANRDAMYGLALMLEKKGDTTGAITAFNDALMTETDATLKATISMHVNQLRGIGNTGLFNIPSITLPTEQVGANILAPDSSMLKSETSSLLKIKRPPGGESASE